MKSTILFPLTACLIVISCSTKTRQPANTYHPDVQEAIGYVIPADSLEAPTIVKAGNPKVIRAGEPKVIYINSNVYAAGEPEVLPTPDVMVTIPGEDGYALPDTIVAIRRPVLAGAPEIVPAKDPGTKHKNSQRFSFYGRLQGMKTDNFMTIAEDKDGSLWFGTAGAGITKYDGLNFTHYTERQGVGQDIVITMITDKRGNLWIGTLGKGISHFDGRYLTNYTEHEGLSENWITGLTEDKEGNIWIGTLGGGLNKFDGKRFIHFSKLQGLPGDSVLSMSQQIDGSFWIATNAGLTKFDGSRFTNFYNMQPLTGTTNTLFEDSKNNLWVGGLAGLVKYDGRSFNRYGKSSGLSNQVINCIYEDKSGHILIGADGTLIRYDGHSFIEYSENEGFNNFTITDIYEDKRGVLWVTSNGGGVNKFGGDLFTHFSRDEGLPSNTLTGLLETRNGELWMSSWNGLIKKDGKTFTNFTISEGLVHDIVWTVMQDRDGRLWSGTTAGLSIYDGRSFTNFSIKEGLLNEDIKCLLQDSKGFVWIGSTAGLTRYDGENFTHYTEKSGLGSNIIMLLDLMEDKDGRIWIGTGNGVKMFDGKTFTHYRLKKGAGNDVVTGIMQDDTGNIWFGTSSGVVRFDGKLFWRFDEKEGIAAENAEYIIEDEHNIWIGMVNGFSRLNKRRLAAFESYTVRNPDSAAKLFDTYTYEDGLLGFGVNFGQTVCKSKDGTIWLASNRLTAFHPDAVKTDVSAPVVRLQDVKLFNEKIPWQNLLESNKANDTSFVLANGLNVHDVRLDSISNWYGIPQNLSLPYDVNDISFQFVGITMKSPKKVTYKYMLEGMHHQWSVSSKRSEATYGNLPPGDYTFKMKAMNADRQWSDTLQYPFTIRPPWWHTWWAYTLFIFTFAAIIYGLFRYRVNQVKKEHETKHKTTALEMKALRAQMNPHFIFNSLNSINLFIMQNNRLRASEYLSKFSRLVRLILNNSREAFIPLAQELEALELYLELESLRFENKFTYIINIDDNVDSASINVPPMIIQPYVENAIWHGLMHKKGTGNITIDVNLHRTILYCKITDDGVGRKKSAEYKSSFSTSSKSIGMHITSERIAMLQDQRDNEGQIRITDIVLPDGTPGGTEVLLKIPVNHD